MKVRSASSRLHHAAVFRALVLLGTSSAALGAAAPAMAQDFTTGALVATVFAGDGTRATNGNVTVRSVAQGFSRQATIGSDGSFRLSGLPIGEYNVTIAVPGQPEIVEAVTVNAGTNNTYTFRAAAPDATGADIVVTGTVQRVNDLGATGGGLAIPDVTQLLNTTPVARNLTSLILLAPGTTAGDTTFGDLASLSGATVAENAYYVNGLNVTNFRNFLGSNNPPIEFYRSLTTRTFGLPAEYGRVLGGFVTAVTKSGTNDYKAGALLAYSPDGLRNDVPDTYAARNDRDVNEDVEANVYVSGPIIKDRLFFFGLYNPNYQKTENISLLSNQQEVAITRSDFIGGKLDAIIADGHRLEGTYFRNRQTIDYSYFRYDPTNGQVSDSIGQAVDTSGGDNFVVTYNGQFTKWLSLSGSYGENHDDTSSIPSPNQSLVQSTLTGVTRTVRGFQSNADRASDVRKFYRADADVYVNLLGSHHFRGGYEQEQLTSTNDTFRAGGYSYVLSPNFLRRSFYRNAGTWKSKNESYYLQDNWSIADDRLTLQLGLRNDRFSNDALDGNTFNKSGNQWGPRLGGSFDVFGDKRTSVFGSWSRYFLPVATNTNIRLGGAELFYRQRFAYPAGVNPSIVDAAGIPIGLNFDGNGNIVGLGAATTGGACPELAADAAARCENVYDDGVQGPTDTLVSSTLQPSYTDEWNVGVQHRIGDWTFRLAYINRRLGRTLDDIAIDAAVNTYCAQNGIQGCEDVFDGFHQYVLANPGSDVTVRLNGDCTVDARQCEVATLKAADLGFPNAIRKYDSVQFEFTKAYANRWYLQGSYTYTKLRGNYEGAVKSDNGQTDAGLTQDFDQPGLLDGAYGTLANQRAHAFKLFGSYGFTDSFRMGVNVLFESPRPFSCIGNYYDSDNFAFAYQAASYYCAQPRFADRPAFTDPATGRVTYLVNRGSAFDSGWRKNIDLNAQFDIAALPGSFVSVDVFNIFNWKSKLDFQEFGELSDTTLNQRYGEVTGYQAPRYVRFTIGIRLGEQARSDD